MSNRIFLLSIVLLYCNFLCSQNTVGILSQEKGKTYEGYNLLFPHNQSHVYLLDNCGQIVHTWEDNDARPGNSVYLLENGDLVKCKRSTSTGPSDPIWAGGSGETVEILTWDNELLYSFSLNNENFRLHHDVAPMPNGNILMIAWENKNFEEAVAAGRDTALMAQKKVWSEVILEWNPEKDEIIWKWHVWDHLIQNYDATKANFGNPTDHPELINLNYDEHAGHPDWLHINSIDYNPVLDQIALSVPYFNELWVIDHSTTEEEAAGSNGGVGGKGGDLLYRWGNPQAYGRGEEEDQQFFFQHDLHWINPEANEGEEDFGKVALFNNRLAGGRSSGNIVSTLSAEGAYQFEDNVYTPNTFERTVFYPEQYVRAFSNSLSSTQFLPNGNALLLAGRWGFAYEITPTNEVVWEYVVPLKAGSAVNQGDMLNINNNITFRFKRYGLDHPAFEGKDLSPKGYWEMNPNEGFCGVVNTNEAGKQQIDFTVFPNPTTEILTIQVEEFKPQIFRIYNSLGKEILVVNSSNGKNEIDISSLTRGVYIVVDEKGRAKKVIVQ